LNPVFFDFEVMRHKTRGSVWCCGFRWKSASGATNVRVVQNDPEKLRRVVELLLDEGFTFVGFNSESYDLPLMSAILRGEDAIAASARILHDFGFAVSGETERQSRERRQRTWVMRDQWRAIIPEDKSVDLIARTRDDSSERVGLKLFLATSGYPNVTESPVDFDDVIDDPQWDAVVEYNKADLAGTEFVFNHFSGQIAALEAMSEEYDLWLCSKTDSKVGELVMGVAFEKITGTKARAADPPKTVRVEIPDFIHAGRSEQVRGWHDAIRGKVFPYLTTTGEFGKVFGRLDDADPRVAALKRTIHIGDIEVTVALGGLHQISEVGTHLPCEEFDIWDIDVASYYPNLLLNLGLPLGSLGHTGLQILGELLKRRLDAKSKSADKSLSPKERADFKNSANGLKIVVNAVYGKTNYSRSVLYSPEVMYATTLVGQMALVDLLERLVEIGCRPLDSNTDGITLKVPKGSSQWRSVCETWESESGLELEYAPVDAFVVQAGNIRAIKKSGVWSGKGKTFVSLSGTAVGKAQLDPPIVPQAVVRYLTENIPVEQTIRECADPAAFAIVRRLTGHAKKLKVVGQAKVQRVYATFEGQGWTWAATPSEKSGLPEHFADLMQMPAEVPRNLDHGWYVSRARMALQTLNASWMPSDLSGEAKRLWDEYGLVSQPAVGKATARGSSSKIALSGEIWDRYSTTKIYAGVAPGGVTDATPVLIVDIDNPEAWQNAIGTLRFDPLIESALCVHYGDRASVMSGQSRGKLIFRADSLPDGHRLLSVTKSNLKGFVKHGVEVFFRGTVGVSGEHSDGKRYALDGTLGHPPEWLVLLLTRWAGKRSTPSKTTGDFPEDYEPSDDPAVAYVLAHMGYRDLVVKKNLLVCQCYGDHKKNDRTKAAFVYSEYGGDLPRLRYTCKSANCTAVDEVNACIDAFYEGDDSPPDKGYEDEDNPVYGNSLLAPKVAASGEVLCGKGLVSFNGVDAGILNKAAYPVYGGESPLSENTGSVQSFNPEILRTAITDRLEGTTGLVHLFAPTGSGKSHSLAALAIKEALAGRNILIVTPTWLLGTQYRHKISELHPEMVDRIVMTNSSRLEEREQDDWAANPEPDEFSEIAATVKGTIFIGPHAVLMRRGFSPYLPRIYEIIRNNPDMTIVVDESHKFIESCVVNIDLVKRYSDKPYHNECTHKASLIQICPMDRHAFSITDCRNCHETPSANVIYQTKFNALDLGEPRFRKTSQDLALNMIPDGLPFKIPIENFRLAAPVNIDDTGVVQSVIGFNFEDGFEFIGGAEERRRLPREHFRGRELTPESVRDKSYLPRSWRHLLLCLIHAQIKQFVPKTVDGSDISLDEIRDRLDKETGVDDIVFPYRACNAPFLHAVDALPLEALREHTSRHGRVIMATATPSELLEDSVAEVFRAGGVTTVEGFEVRSGSKIDELMIATVNPRRGSAYMTEMSSEQSDVLSKGGPIMFVANSSRQKETIDDNWKHGAFKYATTVGSGYAADHSKGQELNSPNLLVSLGQAPVTGLDNGELRTAVADFGGGRVILDILTRKPRDGENYVALYEKARIKQHHDLMRQLIGRLLRGTGRKLLLLLNVMEVDLEREVITPAEIRTRTESIKFVDYRAVTDHIFSSGKAWLSGECETWPAITDADNQRRQVRRRPIDQLVLDRRVEERRASLVQRVIEAKKQGTKRGDVERQLTLSRHYRNDPGLKTLIDEIFLS
jgi:hypothetical protein